MAGGATSYTAGEILNLILRAVSPTFPATMYLRLLTTPSTKTTSGTEATFGAYARIPLVRATSLFTNPLLTGRSTNVDPITTDVPSSGGADIVGFDLVNTASGAFTETYLFGTVTPARSVVIGKRIRFPANSMEVTC